MAVLPVAFRLCLMQYTGHVKFLVTIFYLFVNTQDRRVVTCPGPAEVVDSLQSAHRIQATPGSPMAS